MLKLLREMADGVVMLVLLLTVIACVVTLISWIRSFGRNELQRELVEQGVAEYYLDDEGKKRWRIVPSVMIYARNEPAKDKAEEA